MASIRQHTSMRYFLGIVGRVQHHIYYKNFKKCLTYTKCSILYSHIILSVLVFCFPDFNIPVLWIIMYNISQFKKHSREYMGIMCIMVGSWLLLYPSLKYWTLYPLDNFSSLTFLLPTSGVPESFFSIFMSTIYWFYPQEFWNQNRGLISACLETDEDHKLPDWVLLFNSFCRNDQVINLDKG